LLGLMMMRRALTSQKTWVFSHSAALEDGELFLFLPLLNPVTSTDNKHRQPLIAHCTKWPSTYTYTIHT
jgi:hypothetical protein